MNALTVRVASGPPLTAEDGDRITAAVVAELVGLGCDARGWECVPREE